MSEEQLRTVYEFAKQNAHSLENLLREVEDDKEEDSNLSFAISDAKNIMNVLTRRTGFKLGFP